MKIIIDTDKTIPFIGKTIGAVFRLLYYGLIWLLTFYCGVIGFIVLGYSFLDEAGGIMGALIGCVIGVYWARLTLEDIREGENV